ncbi:MAG: hypothetical protein AAF320_02940, partial [Myxococcota bacterium]
MYFMRFKRLLKPLFFLFFTFNCGDLEETDKKTEEHLLHTSPTERKDNESIFPKNYNFNTKKKEKYLQKKKPAQLKPPGGDNNKEKDATQQPPPPGPSQPPQNSQKPIQEETKTIDQAHLLILLVQSLKTTPSVMLASQRRKVTASLNGALQHCEKSMGQSSTGLKHSPIPTNIDSIDLDAEEESPFSIANDNDDDQTPIPTNIDSIDLDAEEENPFSIVNDNDDDQNQKERKQKNRSFKLGKLSSFFHHIPTRNKKNSSSSLKKDTSLLKIKIPNFSTSNSNEIPEKNKQKQDILDSIKNALNMSKKLHIKNDKENGKKNLQEELNSIINSLKGRNRNQFLLYSIREVSLEVKAVMAVKEINSYVSKSIEHAQNNQWEDLSIFARKIINLEDKKNYVIRGTEKEAWKFLCDINIGNKNWHDKLLKIMKKMQIENTKKFNVTSEISDEIQDNISLLKEEMSTLKKEKEIHCWNAIKELDSNTNLSLGISKAYAGDWLSSVIEIGQFSVDYNEDETFNHFLQDSRGIDKFEKAIDLTQHTKEMVLKGRWWLVERCIKNIIVSLKEVNTTEKSDIS